MKLIELSNNILSFPLNEYFCCDWSKDDKIFIINSYGIDIHHFKPNPKSKQQTPEFQRSFIFPVANSPTENAGFDEKFLLYFDKMDLTRALSNPLVTPQFSFNTPSPAMFKKAAWSPLGILPSKNCLLAAQTFLGSVTIWYYVETWSALLDISHLIYLQLKQNESLLPVATGPKETLDNVIFNCNQLACSSMAWCDATYQENNQAYSYFMTAQKSGTIYIWKLIPEETVEAESLNSCLEFNYSCDIGEICEMHWITHSKTNFTVILGTTNGLIQSLHLKKTNSKLQFVKLSKIWDDEDNLALDKIASMKWNKTSSLVFAIKRTFLISFLLDENNTATNIQHKNFGNLNITSLQVINEKNICLSTLTGVLFLIEIVTNENNLVQLKSSVIESNINYKNFVQHGLCFSQNNALWLNLLTPCRRMKKFRGKISSKFVVRYVEGVDPIEQLLKNESKLLTNQWDVLELFRVLKSKNLYVNPQLDFLQNINNCETLNELKLCLWLNVISKSVLESETIVKNLHKRILLLHCVNYFKNLLLRYKTIKQLSQGELETLSLQNKVIKCDYNNYCKFDDLLSTLDLPSISKYCEWCDEELSYPICSHNHPREFCCVTFRDVESTNVLICTLCDAVAHIDLKSSEPICTFCDTTLKHSPVCGERKEDELWKTNVENLLNTESKIKEILE